MYDIVRTVDADQEPVTVDQAKAHARINTDDDDALLATYITAARQYCEKITGRAFLTQTWRLSLEHFPFWRYRPRGVASTQHYHWAGVPNWWRPVILLPRPNLIAVSSITYLDTTGAEQTLDSSLYLVDTDGLPGAVQPQYNATWPFTTIQRGAVKVTYTAGYGDDPEDVPATLQLAILQLVAHWYENRESTVLPQSGTGIIGVPMGFAELIESETFTAFTFES
jgi:uncharacterized phiE125 gp8 family phage protein